MAELTTEEVRILIDKSYRCRKNILKMMRYGEGHIGGAFSSIDIITVLYNKIMRHNPRDPKWSDRDRFILSAGHKCLALYTILADQGYFEEDVLWTYNTLDTKVPMQGDEKALPGVEFPTGSLGHGLAVANAMALTARLDRKDYRVFVMLGDGECAEGSVWEAAMASAHHQIDNITAIVDRNGLQVNGRTVDIMNTSPFEDKFKAFGWEVITIDGHDFSQIYSALSSVPFLEKKPSCIIADTIKCKGLSFAEDKFQYHHWHCESSQIDETVNIVDSARLNELRNV